MWFVRKKRKKSRGGEEKRVIGKGRRRTRERRKGR